MKRITVAVALCFASTGAFALNLGSNGPESNSDANASIDTGAKITSVNTALPGSGPIINQPTVRTASPDVSTSVGAASFGGTTFSPSSTANVLNAPRQETRTSAESKSYGGSTLGYTGGNSMSITNNGAPIPDDYRVRNTPDVGTVIANPTAPCRVAFGGSVAVAGFGGGLGGSILDEGCDAREDARLLVNAGLKPEAIARLCQKPEMKLALAGRCAEPVVWPAGSEVKDAE
jgi:hypothetical protein